MEQPSHCLNCGAELQGPYCHACGQPVKGMVRHLRSILHDFLDTVLEYDSRIWRSLLPLYFRPGRITNDYLAGRRMRYVSPFRLFFVLTIVTFLVLQLVVDPEASETTAADAIQEAESVAEAQARRDAALAQIERARDSLDETFGAAGARAGLEAAELAIRRAAEERIDWLRQAEAARAEGREPPPPPSGLYFNGRPWHPELNPLEIAWLPEAANDLLNDWVARAEQNIELVQEDPARLVESFLGLLPAALFVLMPLFALLLKFFYIGRRWLYTAHLVVALHSHSFLAMALLAAVLLGSLRDAIAGPIWIWYPVQFLTTASQLWIPVHLLLMQRRVYTQGWTATVVKFALIGSIYSVMLGLAVISVALISLVIA